MSGVRSSDDLASGVGTSPLSILRTMIGKEQIETPHLIAGAVTADKINVTDLVNIANLLTVAAGQIIIGANVLGVGRNGILIVDGGAVRRVEIGEVAAGVYGINIRDSAGEVTVDEGVQQSIRKRIYATEIGVAVTTVTINGALDGNTDQQYLIFVRWIRGGGAGLCNYHLRPNNDGGANYGFCTTWTVNGASGGSENPAFNSLWIGRADAVGDSSQGWGTLYAKSGEDRVFVGQFSANQTNADMERLYNAACVWNNSAANITSLVFTCDIANGIGIGSIIEIYRKAAGV